MNKFNGLLYGIISSASFGLIPLFAIPAMQHGMDFMNVISYRFLFATIALAVLLKIRKVSFGIEKTDLPTLLLLSFFYLISSVFLLWGYKFMPSGVVTTIHFMYPVITTLVMMLFFHEKNSLFRTLAILMAIGGVYALSYSDSQGETNMLGVIIVLISAVGYALYLVTVGQRKNQSLKGLKLTFYVFLFSTVILLAGMSSTGSLHSIPDLATAGNLLQLAIIPTVVSNLTLIEAIKYIGATQTSVLGAMEPVTAVIVGIAIFGEAFTFTIAVGIILIISAVTIIILKR
jgi:drug/metabolite transporter (DMT)-like permease